MDNQEAAILLSAATAAVLAAEVENREKSDTVGTTSTSRKRRWVKEWRLSREVTGNTQKLLREMNSTDPDDFKNYLRVDEICFNRILSYINSDIEKQDTIMRPAIPAKEKLAVTLRFLATGESYQELDFNTKLSAAFLKESIIEVCEAIYRNMKKDFLKFPRQKEEWEEIASHFERLWNFPLCIGALDGKHIAFTPEKSRAPLFYNYKGFTSIVLLAMADAFGKFTYVDIGCNGRTSDGGVFSRSDLNSVLRNENQRFPPRRIIGNGRLLPYVIVADEAFPLQENLMKPFPYNSVEEPKQYFNKRLSRARQNIERSFGIISNRFRILQTKIKLREEKTKTIVKCCCVLHNFLISHSEWYNNSVDNTELGSSNEGVSSSSQGTARQPNQTAISIRNEFADYFSNEGKR